MFVEVFLKRDLTSPADTRPTFQIVRQCVSDRGDRGLGVFKMVDGVAVDFCDFQALGARQKSRLPERRDFEDPRARRVRLDLRLPKQIDGQARLRVDLPLLDRIDRPLSARPYT